MNAVLDWNEAFLQAIRVQGGAPGPIARAGAILHIAMHDAIVAIAPTHAPYLGGLVAAGTEDKQAAVHRAAHQVLTTLYPDQRASFDAQLAQAAAPGTSKGQFTPGRRAEPSPGTRTAAIDRWGPGVASQSCAGQRRVDRSPPTSAAVIDGRDRPAANQ